MGNGDDRNPWGAHFLQVHANIRAPVVPFKAVITSRTHDHVDRKLTEAIHIAEESPSLNTDSGWQLLPTIRTRPATTTTTTSTWGIHHSCGCH